MIDRDHIVLVNQLKISGLAVLIIPRYIWWQRWDNDNCQTGVALKVDDRVRFVSKNELKSRVKTMLLSMALHN